MYQFSALETSWAMPKCLPALFRSGRGMAERKLRRRMQVRFVMVGLSTTEPMVSKWAHGAIVTKFSLRPSRECDGRFGYKGIRNTADGSQFRRDACSGEPNQWRSQKQCLAA
jgi:hypothetical protein